MKGRCFYDYFNVISQARKIKDNETRRYKSVRFAVSAIMYSIVTVICAALGSFLLTLSDAGLLYIFIIVVAAGLLAGALITLIGATLRVIAQFTINRNTMSWVSLILLLALVAVSVILIFSFIS